jgi:hypothetical protein
VLLAVADSNFHFVYADAGSYGKDSDASIFRNSSLWQKTSAQAITNARQTSRRVNSSSALRETLQCTAQLLTSVVAWSSKSKMQRALERALRSTHVGRVALSV